MRVRTSAALWGSVATALVLASGAGALADHHGGQNSVKVQGVITSFALSSSSGTTNTNTNTNGGANTNGGSSANSGSAGATPVGTLTIVSAGQGAETVTVLSTTRFEVTGAALAENLVGAMAKVVTVQSGTEVDAVKVSVSNERHSEWMQVKGTISAVDTTAGTITIDTSRGSVTAQFDPSTVTVTIGDGKSGSLQDLTVGARVRATWQVAGGQVAITAFRVLGGGDHGGNSGGNNNSNGGGN